MKYCRHFVQLKTKAKTFVLHNFEASFLVSVLSLGTMQNMCNQSVAVLWHYTIIVITLELKIDFSYIKILIFDLFF